MVSQLTNEQVADNWELVKAAIASSMPETKLFDMEVSNNILAGILDGSFQCWASYKLVNCNSEIRVIIITTPMFDKITGKSSLLIHNLASFTDISPREFEEGFLVLRKYCIEKGYAALTAYTDVASFISLGVKLGGRASTFVSIPLT